MNAAALVERARAADPAALAVAHPGGDVSYAELDALAARAAGAFAGLGVRPGDRVALALPNELDHVVAWLGALRMGAVAASVSPLWAAAALAAALDDAEPRVIVATDQVADLVASEAPTLLARAILAGGAGSPFMRLVAGSPAAGAAIDVAAEAPAELLYSSGTAGDPKGVLLSHGNVAGNAAAKARYAGLAPADRLPLFVPLAHCFGQNGILAAAFAAGASVRLYPRFDADAVASDAGRGALTALFGAPAAFARVLDAATDTELAALRHTLSAAAPLPAAVAERWLSRTGRPIRVAYGLTESSPFATYNHRERHVPGTVGTAIRGVRVCVAEPDGDTLLGPGEPGEVVIGGPNIMLGYWRRPDATARALRGGWLRTGDVGRLDDDGYLTLVDRLDDVVNVSGYKVYPSDVERVLARHPLVTDVAAYGVPDDDRGERVGATVVSRAPLSTDALRDFCRARLAPWQVPASIAFAGEIPRSPTGKVLRRVLRAPGAVPRPTLIPASRA